MVRWRRHVGLIGIHVAVWLVMLSLLFAVDLLVVPLRVPAPGYVGSLSTALTQVGLTTALALAWLYIWHRLSTMYFNSKLSERRSDSHGDHR